MWDGAGGRILAAAQRDCGLALRLTAQAVDVLIAGAGPAGACAALEAAAHGASILLVDAQDEFGGTLRLAGGGVCVAGTALQRERDVHDTPELALHDLIAAGEGTADAEAGRRYFERAAPDVHEWLSGLGVEFVDLRPQEDQSVPRWHLPRGAGLGIVAALWQALVRAGLEQAFRPRTSLVALSADKPPGGAIEATLEGPQGTQQVRAARVVVASGGFAGDATMVLEHDARLRAAERILIGGGPGATGSGHHLLMRLGADPMGLGDVWTYPTAMPDNRPGAAGRGLVVRGLGDAIWVDRTGRRFHDESLVGAGSGTPALLARPGQTCWAILDSASIRNLRIADSAFRAGTGTDVDAVDDFLRASPDATSADDPRELAISAGFSPDGFLDTYLGWQGLLASGAERDPLTGRGLVGLRAPIERPLWALRFYPLARKNLGGFRTDPDGRVLRADGSPIGGLFAAGELCGFGGGHLNGRRALEGTMVGGSILSGRRAGAAAAREASRERS